MKVVEKDSPKKTNKKREQNLKGLLYKKGVLEHQIKVAEHGANVSCAYAKEIETRIDVISPLRSLHLPFEHAKLRYELMEVRRVASDYISDFKEFRDQYDRGVKIDLKKVAEEDEFSKIEFEDIEKKAQELVKYELYGTTRVDPENIEHPKIISEIEEYISALEDLFTTTKEELETNKELTPIEKAQLKKNIFDLSIHRQTLNKRLNKRKEYYIGQFLPTFNKDMEDCNKNLQRYLEVMDRVVESGIDPVMKFLKEEYERHKDEREQLWLFYTALRDRLKLIAIEVNLNREKFPKLIECLKEFL